MKFQSTVYRIWFQRKEKKERERDLNYNTVKKSREEIFRIFASPAAFVFIFVSVRSTNRHTTRGFRVRAIARVSWRSRENGPFGRAKANSIVFNAFPFQRNDRYLCERETIVSSFFINARQAAWEGTAYFLIPLY